MMIKCDMTDIIVCSLVFFILYLLRMRIEFEYCSKMVFFFSHCKLHKTGCPYQRTETRVHVRDLQTYLNEHAQLVSFN